MGLNSNQLSFSGELWLQDGVFTTGVRCDRGECCNRISRGFILGDSPRALVLEGFGCAGDESRQCCAIPPVGQRVIVTGELVNTSPLRSSTASDRWHLRGVSMCLRAD